MEDSSLIASTSLLVALLTASRVLGFIREQVLASVFGAGSLMDAYVLALTITAFAFTAVSTVVSSAFLPMYGAMKARGEKAEAAQFARSVFALTLAMCIVISVVGMALAPVLVRLFAPGFEPGVAQTASRLAATLFPAMAVTTITALTAASLNAHGVFGLPATSALVQNVFTIVAILLLARYFSIWGVAVGIVIGTVAGLGIQVPALRKTQVLAGRAYDFAGDAIRKMLALSWPILLTSVVSQVYAIVEKALASGLDEGSLAALNYAFKVSNLPVTVIAGAICTVMFPRLSDLHGKADRNGISEALARSAVAILAVLMPAAVAFGSLSGPIVRVVYQRGAFGEAAVQTTATILVFYAWAITFQALCMLLVRAFYAMHNSTVPLMVTGLGATITVVVDVMLVKSMGARGLALGVAAGALASTIVLLVLLTSGQGIQLVSRIISPSFKIAAACAVMRFVSIWTLARLPVTGGGLLSVVRFFVITCTGAGVYGLCLILFGVLPLDMLVGLRNKAISRGHE